MSIMKQSARSAVLASILAVVAASGIAWAISQGSVSVFGIPVFAGVVALAFVIQWVAFVPAYILQTERFFDITGSITYVLVAGTAVALTGRLDARSLLLLSLVTIWAIRLGSFLFQRILRAGKDARFDDLKPSITRFLMTWTIQGLWVTFTLAAALATMTSAVQVTLDAFAWVGLAIWLVGFAIEALADIQKSRFRKNPANKGRFIQNGLWAWSRHPNYFGEITLWFGIAVIALPVLRGWQWLSLISPLFVTLLITRISGIPLLEKRSDEKWAGQDDYELYKSRTSVLIPWPPKRTSS